jgi:glycosyltransferase involved in cell wall biosynthesis
MKISIVIPVYNEANQLSTCLEAIASQSTKPYEVIVVDNNSDDDSLAIAKKYSFVKVLEENRQGVVHARATGYDYCSGDIIARIDADSILPADWLANIEAVFSDPSIDGVSGVALYYNVSFDYIFNAIDLYFKRKLSRQMENHMYLWGANMAMRKRAWDKVKNQLCMKGKMHEDYDIAIHMQELGLNIVFDERLKARVSSRRIDTDFISFMRYVWRSPDTYLQHDIKVLRYMYPIVLVCAVGYLPARILHRGYDSDIDGFRLAKLLETNTELARVDPTANVA